MLIIEVYLSILGLILQGKEISPPPAPPPPTLGCGKR